MIATLPQLQTDDSSLGELQLLDGCLSGDSTAYDALYQRFRKKVYFLCLGIIHNPSLSEELTQEIFMQFFRSLKSFRGEAALSTWLHRIALNHIRGYLRTKKNNSEFATEQSELQLLLDSREETNLSPSIVDHIALQEAISQLPAGARKIFLLHDVEGYEHHEISDMLKIDVGTSKSQLHKARTKLRKMLNKSTRNIAYLS